MRTSNRHSLALAALAALALGCGGGNGSTTPRAAPLPAGSSSAVAVLRDAALPIRGDARDYDSLLTLVGDARYVLLGESTHGTHEFYRERARISQRLITERGFTAIAVEGDWPDAYRVNEFVRGIGTDASAAQALSSFTRFPGWMWRNEEIRELVQWLREYNMARPVDQRVGFYGLDVYSLSTSIDAVLRHLDATDAAAAAQARASYRCFEPYRGSTDQYGAATRAGTSCQAQAAEVLRIVQARTATRPSDPLAAEAAFSALRNAHAVANAEAYFRTAYTGGMSTWNLRDQRMAENLAALTVHLTATAGRPAKVAVWAHNTHTGDARVTEPGQAGELNIGQLMREREGRNAVLVGFLTYDGQVLAASEWDTPGRVQNVRPALPESFAALFHETGIPNFMVLLRPGTSVRTALSEPRLERAIGVIYLPQTERQSHYFTARLGEQFDAVLYFDRTRAVTPLR